MRKNLVIDAALTLQLMESYLEGLVKAQKSNGLLLGLSGGIDSSVLATIAVKAVGKEHVHVSFLYDRDSEESSQEKARTMADWLGITDEFGIGHDYRRLDKEEKLRKYRPSAASADIGIVPVFHPGIQLAWSPDTLFSVDHHFIPL